MWEHAKQPQAPARRPTLAPLQSTYEPTDEPPLPATSTSTAQTHKPFSTHAQPLFGPSAWALGFTAALPALLSAVVLLACAGAIPRLPRLPIGPALGILAISLGVGVVFAYAANFPAWTQPGLALLPILTLFLPANALYGEVVTQINGDTDPIVLVPMATIWLLIVASCATTLLIAFAISHRAPSFSGTPLLPLPLFIAWQFILTPPFRETLVLLALGSALGLTALATFIAWIVPQQVRPYLPIAAIGIQLVLFWLRRFDWPALTGVARLSLVLDLILFSGLVGVIATAPFWATWVHDETWPAMRRVLGITRE